MAIVASDIAFYLSNPAASAGYSGIGTPGNSLGKYMSTSQISATPLDDLFTDITPAENAASQVDYQCLFVMNNTSSGDTALSPYIWLPLTTTNTELQTVPLYTGSAVIAFAIDSNLVVPYNQSGVQAQSISNSTTEPVGLTWYSPSSTFLGGAPIGDMPPQTCQAIWFQRTATNGAAGTGVGFSVQCVFTTPA